MTNDPQTQIVPMKITPPADSYAEISNITGFMNDTSQINDMLQGKGTSGVRAEGHAALLARISSATQKDKALLIEKSVEKVATLIAKLMFKNDPTIYKISYQNRDIKFVLSEFVNDFKIRINNHSTSPLFAYDIEQTMFALNKMGIVTGQRLVEALNIPNKADILADLKTKTQPSAQNVEKAVKSLDAIKAEQKAEAVLSLQPK